MMLVDPRKPFLQNISLRKSIINFDPPIILLFGGEVNIKNAESTSVREKFVEYCCDCKNPLEDSIKLAEHYKDWYESEHYDNLLVFEEELSQLASLVVIILESPGAIAELGAFCVNDKIKNKLVIVLTEEHEEAKSFITLGLLKLLESESVLAYDWDYDDISSTVKSELPVLAEDIEGLIKTQDVEDIDISNIGHLSYVIHELIIQFRAITSQEIVEYLKVLGVTGLSTKYIKKCLYLLTLFDLIKSRKKGNREFFIANCFRHRVAFSGHKSNYRIDEAELNMSVTRYYAQTEKEDIRYKIISEEHKKNQKEQEAQA